VTTYDETTQAGDRLVAGRYRLLSRLGQGGMGIVWQAEDEVLRRPVAVKELFFPPNLSENEQAVLRERTMREARMAARIDHPAAVRVYDVVEDADRPCIVMELIQGRTLGEVVAQDGPLTPVRGASVGLSVLDALEAAHAAGIVHRDVKPGNVLLRSDGRVTLTDFGIATSSGDSTLTSAGLLLGSPAYIAPERARGLDPGPASDLWSLGATLFTAVEGRPPFDHGEALATMLAVVSDDHEPFRAAGPIAPVISRLLAKEPAERPTAAEARAELAHVASLEGKVAGAAAAVAARAARPEPAAVEGGGHTRALALPVLEAAQAGAVEAGAAAAGSPAPGPTPTSAPRTSPPPTSPATGPAAGPGRAGPPGRPDGSRRTNRALLPLLAAAAAVVAIAAFVLLRPHSGASGTGTAAPAASGPAASASPAGTAASAGTAGGGVPANWTTYKDPLGWSIKMPPGWTAAPINVRGQSLTQLTDPTETSTYLRVQRQGAPSTSPRAEWQSFAPDFAATVANYRQIKIVDVSDYRGYRSADWEFTFDAGGTTLHAIDRMAVTPNGTYALLYQTRATKFAGAQDQISAFLASFQP